MIVKYPFLIIVLLIFLSNHSFSQNTSEFSGRVLDNSNQQPLAGVSVTLLNDDEVVSGAETDENGFFLIKNLDAGFYQARFSLLGYETFLLNDVVLRSGIPTDVLIEMKEYTTDEIVVEEILRRPSDISNSFKSLTNEEIRRSPGGFEDIGRVLQTLPGVSFVNDGRNDLLVRGGSPTENLFI